MYKSNEKVVLASKSPRRKQFLQESGIEFEIISDEIDESVLAGEDPKEYVLRIAQQKGEVVGDKLADRWILSADTIVVYDDKILGKPVSKNHALQTLLSLSGKTHKVMTSFCLLHKNNDILKNDVVETDVTFTNFPESVAKAYVESGEPMDKAGAYGIQGNGGLLIKKINGSYSNVVGLPMVELLDAFTICGIIAGK